MHLDGFDEITACCRLFLVLYPTSINIHWGFTVIVVSAMRFSHLFYFLIVINSALGDLVISHRNLVGYQACSKILGGLVVYSTPDQFYTQNYCNPSNTPALGAMSYCLHQLGNLERDIPAFVKSCRLFLLTSNQVMSAYNNATLFLIFPDNTTIPAALWPQYPLAVNSTTALSVFELEYNALISQNYTTWFGIALVLYWFVVMFVAAIFRWSYYLFPGFIKFLHGPISNAVRRHLILAPLGSKLHAQHKSLFTYFHYYLPLRFESLLVFGWLVLVAVFCAVKHIPGTEPLPDQIGDRTGVLTLFSMPVLILFAGRNNLMQWVTGWSFSRFLLFHRWIARIVFAMVIVHAGAQTKRLLNYHAYLSGMQLTYVRCGELAGVAMGVMVFHSLRVFRQSRYELFVLTHVILAVFLVVGSWIHVAQFGLQKFMYAATAIWVFDRVIRLIRVMLFGIQNAVVELQAGECLRVTVPRPSYWKPHPGSHAFVYFWPYFWQSHPFSVVDSIVEPNTVTFYIKIKGGLTNTLCQNLLKAPGHKLTIRVMIDGPYSQQLPLHIFESVVFLAGGNGVPGLYYEAIDLAKRTPDKQIKFYWVVRHEHSLDWFHQELMKLKGTNIECIVYLTSQFAIATAEFTGSKEKGNNPFKEQVDADSQSIVSNSAPSTKKYPHIQFRPGRPDIRELVDEEIVQAPNAIAFATCAHPGMVDDARVAVHDALSANHNKRIELFEEIQGW